jgi:DNA invertase Pin-like site-specific DNA recombinase
MIYGYARVSTNGQAKNGNSLEVQENTLRDAGATKIYKDTFTGTKALRPQLSELLDALQEGDTIIITKLDRIARSMTQGLEMINDLISKGIKVNILSIGMMDNTPSSKLIRKIFFSFADFERDMIVERTQEGKAIAKTKAGYTEGRPKAYTEQQITDALEYLKKHSYPETTKAYGISKSTLIRAKREREGK